MLLSAFAVAALLYANQWLFACAAIAAITLAFPLFQQTLSTGADVEASERPHPGVCADWDEAASEAIVDLVKAWRDTDLRLVGDAVYRMRRARRNCHMGWMRLACLDYQAVIQGSPGLCGRLRAARFRLLSPGRRIDRHRGAALRSGRAMTTSCPPGPAELRLCRRSEHHLAQRATKTISRVFVAPPKQPLDLPCQNDDGACHQKCSVSCEDDARACSTRKHKPRRKRQTGGQWKCY